MALKTRRAAIEPKVASGEKRKRVLIVDDDEHVLMVLQAMLENEGYDTTVTWEGHDALELLETWPFDLVLLDEHLPDIDSGTILKHIQDMPIRPLTVVMQAEPAHEALSRFFRSGRARS